MEVLKEYHEGIIALSACLAGEVPGCLLKDDYEGAKAAVQRHLEIFGKDNYFLELQDHGIPEQKKANAGIIRLSQETGVGLVCTNDVHYTFAEDAEAHDILLCIQSLEEVRGGVIHEGIHAACRDNSSRRKGDQRGNYCRSIRHLTLPPDRLPRW